MTTILLTEITIATTIVLRIMSIPNFVIE